MGEVKEHEIKQALDASHFLPSQQSSRGSAKRPARDPDLVLVPVWRFVDFAKPQAQESLKCLPPSINQCLLLYHIASLT
jgi:hypothetical protein